MKLVLKSITAALLFLGLTVGAQAAKGNKGNRVETFLKRNDSNNDGVVDKSEFKGKEKRFNHLDKNHDGKLDKAELEAFAEKAKRPGGKKKAA